ncbi:MAG TPA: nucleoside kinase, partial [Lachnospiraceae bacterium]
MENFYQVKVKNETKAYKVGTTYGEIADDFLHLYSAQPVLAFVKGRLREFHKCLKEDSVIDFVTLEDTIGYSAYQRSMVFLMLKAFYHVVGKENIEKIVLHYSIGSGFYFTLRGKVNLDAQVMENVKSYMRKLVEEKLPIEKRNIGTKAAIDLFHFHGMTDKEKLFRFRRVSRVNIYKLGNFEDYFYGYMLWHTGYLKLFDLFCYDEGFVLHLPKRKAMDRLPVFKEEPKLFAIQQKSEKWGEMLNVDTVGSLNECIAKEKMKELILIQEALQEGELSKIAEQIKAKEGIKFVMIAGPSSSGKTTFSHRLSIQLLAHGLKPHPIAVDNYFVNREDTPLDEFGNKNYECLEAIDIEQFNKDMRSLAAGERVELPEFNFKTGK